VRGKLPCECAANRQRINRPLDGKQQTRTATNAEERDNRSESASDWRDSCRDSKAGRQSTTFTFLEWHGGGEAPEVLTLIPGSLGGTLHRGEIILDPPRPCAGPAAVND
jgi:hypothetical protein